MNTRSILRAGMLAALCGIGPMAAVAGAAPITAQIVHSTSVSLSDLDLSTADGRRMARDRLHATARRLCSQVADDLDLSHQANFVACVDETLANALRQLDALTHKAVAQNARQGGAQP